ncbi:MAG: thiamine phosphate synthase [Nitrospirae bacterium]|nr:thiamine phosphate synthase [Nitrospirota bacterium]
MSSELIDFRLYLITDRKILITLNSELRTPNLLVAIEEALKGGLKAVQLREKDLGTRDLLDMAYRMRELTKKYDAKLFINDRVDIALAVEGDGVHLGQKSIPAHAAKKIVQDKLMIGVSTHSLDEAVKAEKDGADFITIGPIYQTPSKLKYGEPIGIDVLKKVKSKVSIPLFAIGGIKLNKVKEIMNAGADGVALISAILSVENIKEKTEEFLRLLR